MFKLKAEFYLKTIFIFSAIALSSAFFIEYILYDDNGTLIYETFLSIL